MKNMKKGLWADEEVKSLFASVERIKAKSGALKEAFLLHAQKYSRQPNSVRNYYYHEVDNLWKDKQRAMKLQIDLKKHQKSKIDYFSKEQEEDLMKKIDRLVRGGSSVRKACFTLANGDVGVMLRYQNKYRNFHSKNKVEKPDNIIKFARKKEVLSESDINSLFLGLVRLVKKSAVEEASEKMKSELEKANSMLRKAIVEIGEKDEQIARLKSMFAKVKDENKKLMDGAVKSNCDKASKLRKKLAGKSKTIVEG